MRYLPLAGVVLMVLIAGCLRPWLQFRRHGTFGVLLLATCFFELFLQPAAAADRLLLLLPVGLQPRPFFLEVSQLLFEPGQPLL